MGSEDDAECLGLETIAQLISKEPRGARLAELEGHVARCTRCQQLIAAAAYGAEDVDSKAPSVTALGGGQRVERFASGDVIAGRFEVRRFIARGGMGEVYDVDDRELGARIALKVMAVEARAEPEALARFRREVALARSVTHPNVCRVFDVGFHSRQGARVAFMTMELLSGETLSARLRRVGRIPFERALPIVRDVCAGLSAAHSAGVIHRDFKSSNVILEGDDASLLRAVITDFGLACLHEGDATLTRRGQVLGTPATMAPEQILAEGITAATDVYALGCVLFEMFSGTLPFASSNATASLSLRLTQPAPLLRSRAPEALAHCESVVARCLERAQERRFQTVEEVLTGLESGASTRAPLLRRTKVAQVAAALAACAATGLSVWWAARDRLPSAALSPMPALAGGSDVVQTGAPLLARGSAGTPQRLAIFPPRDLSSHDERWLGTAFSEMLATELGGSSRLQLIPGERVARALRDLASDGGAASDGSPERLAAVVGADVILVGSYAVVGEGEGERVRVDLAVFDAVRHRELAKVASVGTTGLLFELVAQVGAELRERLELPPMEPAVERGVRAATSESPAAVRAYAEALAALRAFDLKTASERFLYVVEVDPSCALGHSELANVYRLMGKDDLARKEASRALVAAHELTRELELVVQGRAHAASQEWASAAESFDTLFRFYPSNAYYGTQLVRMVINDGRPKDAFDLIARLRTLPPPVSGDPEIDVLEALTASKASDFARCLRLAQTVLDKGQAAGSPSLIAEGKSLIAEAQYHLGDRQGALDNRLEAHALYQGLDDRRGVARALDALGDLYFEAGDFDKALHTKAEALDIARAIGHQYRVGGLLSSIGEVQQARGDLVAARRAYELARDTYLGMNEREGVGHTTTNIGSILFEEGALKEARSAYEEALAIHGAVGARLGEGYEHIQIARVAQAAGDLREARERCQRGRSILESLSDRAIVADALLALSDIHRDEDDVASARQAASDALDIDRALGDWPASHDAQLQLARLALDEGDGATGARRADAVVSEPGSSPAHRALAHALRARAFVLAGKLADADAATALAANAAATLQGFISPAEVRLLTAEQRARAGWQKEAIDTAREVLAQARAKGHVKLSFEARLLLVRLNPRDSAQSRALSIAARAQQFARIARLAKASPRALGR